MPNELSRSRSLSIAARWPVGVALTSWRYMWRTAPMRRRERPVSRRGHEPPPLPDDVETGDVQTPDDGVGPLFHRRYRVRVRDAQLHADALIARMRADLDAFSPSEFATFRQLSGEGRLERGHEYVVRMPGPWDGPVRVVAADDTSLRLATLAGHLEAGQIEFRAEEDGELRFTIESWARSGDRLSNLLYTRMRMAKEVQLHMWVSVLERVVEATGGRRSGYIEIETARVDDFDAPGAASPAREHAQR